MKYELIHKADEQVIALELKYGRSPDVEVRELPLGDLSAPEEVEHLVRRAFVEGVRFKALHDAHTAKGVISSMMKEVGA